MAEFLEEALDVLGDEVGGGDEEEGDEGGEEDSEGEGDGHGLEELGLEGGFGHEGEEAGEGGEGGEEDGAETAGPGLQDGFVQGESGVAAAVDEVDEDEGIIHDDTGEGEDAEDGKPRGRLVHDDVAEHGSDDAEGDGEQNEEGLDEGLEGDGEEGIDGEDEESGTDEGAAEGFAIVGDEAGVLPSEAGAGEKGVDFWGGVAGNAHDGDFVVADLGIELVDLGAVDAVEPARGAGELDVGGGGEGNLGAVGSAQDEVVEGVESLAVGFGETDHDADVVAVALDTLRLFAEKGGADLVGEFALGETDLGGAGLESELDLFAAALGVVPGGGHAPGLVGVEEVFDLVHHFAFFGRERSVDADLDGAPRFFSVAPAASFAKDIEASHLAVQGADDLAIAFGDFGVSHARVLLGPSFGREELEGDGALAGIDVVA